jgi:hypothetical protein
MNGLSSSMTWPTPRLHSLHCTLYYRLPQLGVPAWCHVHRILHIDTAAQAWLACSHHHAPVAALWWPTAPLTVHQHIKCFIDAPSVSQPPRLPQRCAQSTYVNAAAYPRRSPHLPELWAIVCDAMLPGNLPLSGARRRHQCSVGWKALVLVLCKDGTFTPHSAPI